ncbi:MAG: preprotein translocase subunit SecE [Tissierellia bacterium]|nr:preprotein translocase subunit SecE [Tissierellia bacterium]MDD4726837.1 preprotein translocase subunit SecE [Tissierellia bacterium]
MSSNTNTNTTGTKSKKLNSYFKGVRSEMKKVIWPTKKELFNYTGVVILISILVAVIVYIIDLLVGGLISFII